ncbi:MAG: hypothetical protein L0214_00080 [candidate division NC10 bacterium]|nr:hypothetical protein [candidate division NC10 bacterium]
MPYEDIQTGDLITIDDEGKLVDWEYGTKRVTANGTQKKLSLSPTSVNKLIDGFGPDTKAWVGREEGAGRIDDRARYGAGCAVRDVAGSGQRVVLQCLFLNPG